MRFTNEAVEMMAGRLTQLGLKECPICGGTTMEALQKPAIVHFGGFINPGGPVRDPEANVFFAVLVECSLCGYMMTFNSDKFFRGDKDRILRYDPPDVNPG